MAALLSIVWVKPADIFDLVFIVWSRWWIAFFAWFVITFCIFQRNFDLTLFHMLWVDSQILGVVTPLSTQFCLYRLRPLAERYDLIRSCLLSLLIHYVP